MHRHREQSGAALAELTIALGILATVSFAAARSFVASHSCVEILAMQELLDERLRKGAERIVNRLRGAGVATLADVPDAPAVSSSIRFRQIENYDFTQGPIWGPEERIWLRQPPGGIIMGNPDRVSPIRTGAVAWDSGTERTPWILGVTDLAFSRDGARIQITLQAEAMSPKGERIVITRRNDVTLQN